MNVSIKIATVLRDRETATTKDHFAEIRKKVVKKKAIQIDVHQTQERTPPKKLSGIMPSCSIPAQYLIFKKIFLGPFSLTNMEATRQVAMP